MRQGVKRGIVRRLTQRRSDVLTQIKVGLVAHIAGDERIQIGCDDIHEQTLLNSQGRHDSVLAKARHLELTLKPGISHIPTYDLKRQMTVAEILNHFDLMP